VVLLSHVTVYILKPNGKTFSNCCLLREFRSNGTKSAEKGNGVTGRALSSAQMQMSVRPAGRLAGISKLTGMFTFFHTQSLLTEASHTQVTTRQSEANNYRVFIKVV